MIITADTSLTVSGRWDGASQLAKGNKWAFFPSAALGWRLDQEAIFAGCKLAQSVETTCGSRGYW